LFIGELQAQAGIVDPIDGFFFMSTHFFADGVAASLLLLWLVCRRGLRLLLLHPSILSTFFFFVVVPATDCSSLSSQRQHASRRAPKLEPSFLLHTASFQAQAVFINPIDGFFSLLSCRSCQQTHVVPATDSSSLTRIDPIDALLLLIRSSCAPMLVAAVLVFFFNPILVTAGSVLIRRHEADHRHAAIPSLSPSASIVVADCFFLLLTLRIVLAPSIRSHRHTADPSSIVAADPFLHGDTRRSVVALCHPVPLFVLCHCHFWGQFLTNVG